MPRMLVVCAVLFLAGLTITGGLAQSNVLPQPGDPPVASLISISPADASGIVTINGAAGAVFPGAQVAVRNLYTDEVVYTQAGIQGTFRASLFGPGNTPFWISPAQSIPNSLRDRPGSLPGGPGTILYGPFPETRVPSPLPVTQIIVDGAAGDWRAYPQAVLPLSDDRSLLALINQDSLYLALPAANLPDAYLNIQIIFTLEGAVYSVRLNPRIEEQTALWRRISPNAADLGTLPVAATQASYIELRVPLIALRPIIGATIEEASLVRIELLGPNGTEPLQTIPVEQTIPILTEVDGIVYPDGLIDAAARFTLAGGVGGGSARWTARGRIGALELEPGAPLRLQFDVTVAAPGLAEDIVGLKMIGQVALQPVIGPDGLPATGGIDSNNGWSAVLTTGGLPIDNLSSAFILGETITPAPRVLRGADQLSFGLDFDLRLPDDLPPGRYVPMLRGFTQIADGERIPWGASGLLGTGNSPTSAMTRLPVVLGVGEVPSSRLLLSLFHDLPTDGGRGLLSVADSDHAALSNRVQFTSPTYILPPTETGSGYPLEPYLINQMPNRYNRSSAPLIPFLFPGGRMLATVERPDGDVDNLGSIPILQNQLSTAALDERERYGAQSPLDIYRLTTLNPLLTRYPFDEYGEYQIDLGVEILDIWGAPYTGGGRYTVLIAEPLELIPGALSGTPYEVGDAFNPGLRLLPGVPADVTITARIDPVNGGDPITHRIEGRANRFGYFHDAEQGFRFEEPGEYIIDYEARFTDAEGRLWAASMRSAGLIATPNGELIARGRRGLDGYEAEVRPAWFNARRYGPAQGASRMQYPYHAGDVLWYPDDPASGVLPIIELQDRVGRLAAWLMAALPDFADARGDDLARRDALDSLPVFLLPDAPFTAARLPDPDRIPHEAYNYISAVRPALSVRQYVAGGLDGGLPLHWDPTEVYSGQIGAGISGDRPGDYVFMFGGAVVRNPEAEIAETAIYGALGIVIDPRADGLGPRVYPPYRGQAGGPDGGPLLTVAGGVDEAFFLPTGTAPGQVLTVGDTLSLAGHVGPPLDSRVRFHITAPDGTTHDFEGLANAVGYFYQPDFDLVVDQAGIWQIETTVIHDGLTSAGPMLEPARGGLVGVPDARYAVYVVEPDSQPLAWNNNEARVDIAIPGGLPYNFNFALPPGWTDYRVDHIITIPGYVMARGPLTISGQSFSYQYNPTNLSRDFPMFETDARLNGPASADLVTLTFVATGVDEAGTGQIRTRTFTILYDRLLTLE